MSVQKERFQRPQIQFSSKVAKFAVQIRIDLTIIFRLYVLVSFFAFEIESISVIIVFKFYKCFFFKNDVHVKWGTMLWSKLLYSWVFFVRSIAFKLLSVLYFTAVYSDLN